jgi:hypothetical protein
MLLGAAIILHRLLTRNASSNKSIIYAVGIAAGVSAAIWAHIELGESTLHQVVFASMMLTSAYKTASLITTTMEDKASRRQMRAAGTTALGKHLIPCSPAEKQVALLTLTQSCFYSGTFYGILTT